LTGDADMSVDENTGDGGAGATPKSSDVAALEPGQTVYEYRIDKVLGGGGFGITYLAQDVNLQLPVAIKEYFPANVAVRDADRSVRVRSQDGVSRFDWGLERFVDEARALASFRHPNIVRVLRYFKENGTAYIVMDYESGDPLKHWVARQRGLDQAALLQLVFPLLDGLEAVHKLNFLHRDIKPDNIYIRADGSPVLLDFGAARRVSADHDMTNIVSPGFAPFEQYHSKGNQGPWTDLYSLGAVMYWLTTGRKPLEAASRVRDDAMPKAVDVASRAAFGEPVLRAIDWALQPHEKDRPQDVAALREALRSAEDGPTQLRTQLMSRVMTHSETGATDVARMGGGASRPGGEDSMRKNVMGTIMFLDLVGYSKRSVDQQVALKTLFNELIAKAIGGVDASSRIMLDTGDGAAICFLGDPEEALLSAQLLRDLLLQKYNQKLSLRVGLHLGPVRMLKDINDRVNVVGDGINVAQRIMDFSSANQIMVSRAYFDVISRISDGADGLFEFLGERQDKHQRAHEIYRLLDRRAAPSSIDEATTLLMTASDSRGRGPGDRGRSDPGHRPAGPRADEKDHRARGRRPRPARAAVRLDPGCRGARRLRARSQQQPHGTEHDLASRRARQPLGAQPVAVAADDAPVLRRHHQRARRRDRGAQLRGGAARAAGACAEPIHRAAGPHPGATRGREASRVGRLAAGPGGADRQTRGPRAFSGLGHQARALKPRGTSVTGNHPAWTWRSTTPRRWPRSRRRSRATRTRWCTTRSMCWTSCSGTARTPCVTAPPRTSTVTRPSRLSAPGVHPPA
jgi:serine/threonine protein kinase